MLIFCAHSVSLLSLPLCPLSLSALTPSVPTQSLCSHSLRLLQSGNQKADLLCTLSLTAFSHPLHLFQLGNQEARHLSPVHTRCHHHHPLCLLQSGNAILCPLSLTALTLSVFFNQETERPISCAHSVSQLSLTLSSSIRKLCMLSLTVVLSSPLSFNWETKTPISCAHSVSLPPPPLPPSIRTC